ncbi:MAG: type III secretion system export apparatus subunit SctT [Deltaproteobacteria bacterium]|jgi:type III secretion protein T|nr:type III secretion system export apparatus subunit SctT [Deltaproteobacteria bacterium]
MGATLETFFTQDGYTRLTLLLLLGLPRLTGALSVNPIFSGQIFSGQTKFAICTAIFMIPAPALALELPSIMAFQLGWPYYMAIMIKETVVGLAIGWVSGMVFWAVQSAGFLMDNQRGSSMATTQDPLSGEETSPLGSMLFQGVAVAFFLGGGFVAYLRLIWASYAIWPLTAFVPAFGYGAGPLFFVSLVDWLMLQTLLLAGPVVAACLLTDVSLGLVNRFASQLNVYVLSMPIKSGLAMFILVSYYGALIALSPELFEDLFEHLYQLTGAR